jgi:hypothetical protein
MGVLMQKKIEKIWNQEIEVMTAMKQGIKPIILFTHLE